MKDLMKDSIKELKRKGVDYADLRKVESRSQRIRVKNGEVEGISSSQDSGFGIRVLKDGAWGFSSSAVISEEEVERVASEALQIASASASVNKDKSKLSEEEPWVDLYQSSYSEDPFQIPLEEKIELLMKAVEAMKGDKIRVAEGSLAFDREWKLFLNTEGTEIEQVITQSGGGVVATAFDGRQVQKRSYPNSSGGDFATKGYEFVRGLKLVENAERVREEAIALLSAPECPEGETDIIIGGSQLALQVHESCGHPTELDRVLGTEISYAGGSFLGLDKLNKLQYGSNLVNITADATLEGGLGTFGYDDEGVKAQRTYLVRRGLFVGYLTSRETAPLLGQRSNGAMRADGWNRIPLIRMTNINLEPGDWNLEDLIADTREGIYLETNKSWSIDDLRLNFQFGTEIGWEIRKGKRVRMVKNPIYTGITPQFWNNLDAVCNRESWHIWGIPNCGKGEPSQIMRVAHGTSPARFRKVKVGVKR